MPNVNKSFLGGYMRTGLILLVYSIVTMTGAAMAGTLGTCGSTDLYLSNIGWNNDLTDNDLLFSSKEAWESAKSQYNSYSPSISDVASNINTNINIPGAIFSTVAFSNISRSDISLSNGKVYMCGTKDRGCHQGDLVFTNSNFILEGKPTGDKQLLFCGSEIFGSAWFKATIKPCSETKWAEKSSLLVNDVINGENVTIRTNLERGLSRETRILTPINNNEFCWEAKPSTSCKGEYVDCPATDAFANSTQCYKKCHSGDNGHTITITSCNNGYAPADPYPTWTLIDGTQTRKLYKKCVQNPTSTASAAPTPATTTPVTTVDTTPPPVAATVTTATCPKAVCWSR